MRIMLRMRALPAGFIAPCLPTKTDKLPSGGQWLHEIKHDGFRIIAARLARTPARWSASWASMATPGIRDRAAAAIPCGTREELASGLSDVLFMQQIIRKANHGALKNPLFRCVIVSVRAFCHWNERTPLGPSCGANFQGGYIMLKILTALAASL